MNGLTLKKINKATAILIVASMIFTQGIPSGWSAEELTQKKELLSTVSFKEGVAVETETDAPMVDPMVTFMAPPAISTVTNTASDTTTSTSTSTATVTDTATVSTMATATETNVLVDEEPLAEEPVDENAIHELVVNNLIGEQFLNKNQLAIEPNAKDGLVLQVEKTADAAVIAEFERRFPGVAMTPQQQEAFMAQIRLELEANVGLEKETPNLLHALVFDNAVQFADKDLVDVVLADGLVPEVGRIDDAAVMAEFLRRFPGVAMTPELQAERMAEIRAELEANIGLNKEIPNVFNVLDVIDKPMDNNLFNLRLFNKNQMMLEPVENDNFLNVFNGIKFVENKDALDAAVMAEFERRFPGVAMTPELQAQRMAEIRAELEAQRDWNLEEPDVDDLEQVRNELLQNVDAQIAAMEKELAEIRERLRAAEMMFDSQMVGIWGHDLNPKKEILESLISQLRELVANGGLSTETKDVLTNLIGQIDVFVHGDTDNIESLNYKMINFTIALRSVALGQLEADEWEAMEYLQGLLGYRDAIANAGSLEALEVLRNSPPQRIDVVSDPLDPKDYDPRPQLDQMVNDARAMVERAEREKRENARRAELLAFIHDYIHAAQNYQVQFQQMMQQIINVSLPMTEDELMNILAELNLPQDQQERYRRLWSVMAIYRLMAEFNRSPDLNHPEIRFPDWFAAFIAAEHIQAFELLNALVHGVPENVDQLNLQELENLVHEIKAEMGDDPNVYYANIARQNQDMVNNIVRDLHRIADELLALPAAQQVIKKIDVKLAAADAKIVELNQALEQAKAQQQINLQKLNELLSSIKSVAESLRHIMGNPALSDETRTAIVQYLAKTAQLLDPAKIQEYQNALGVVVTILQQQIDEWLLYRDNLRELRKKLLDPGDLQRVHDIEAGIPQEPREIAVRPLNILGMLEDHLAAGKELLERANQELRRNDVPKEILAQAKDIFGRLGIQVVAARRVADPACPNGGADCKEIFEFLDANQHVVGKLERGGIAAVVTWFLANPDGSFTQIDDHGGIVIVIIVSEGNPNQVKVTVNPDGTATVVWQGQTYSGVLNFATLQLVVQIPNGQGTFQLAVDHQGIYSLNWYEKSTLVNGQANTNKYFYNAQGYVELEEWTSSALNYEAAGKNFATYDALGNETKTLSVFRSLYNGVTRYHISYSIREGNKRTHVDSDITVDLTDTVHSANDHPVADQYINSKTESYFTDATQRTLSFNVGYRKNEAGEFIPRTAGLNNRVYIVRGKVDLLSDETDDIFITALQYWNGYSVFYGEYRGNYGLVFTKGNTYQVIDFPNHNRAVLDGVEYEVSFTAEGFIAMVSVDQVRDERLRNVDAQMAAVQKQIAELPEQIQAAKMMVDAQIAGIQEHDINPAKMALESLLTRLNGLLAENNLNAETRAAVTELAGVIDRYIHSDNNNADGLSFRTGLFFSAMSQRAFGRLEMSLRSAQSYLIDLQTYRAAIVHAQTLDELEALKNDPPRLRNIPVEFPDPVQFDPRPELDRLANEARALIERANTELRAFQMAAPVRQALARGLGMNDQAFNELVVRGLVKIEMKTDPNTGELAAFVSIDPSVKLADGAVYLFDLLGTQQLPASIHFVLHESPQMAMLCHMASDGVSDCPGYVPPTLVSGDFTVGDYSYQLNYVPETGSDQQGSNLLFSVTVFNEKPDFVCVTTPCHEQVKKISYHYENGVMNAAMIDYKAETQGDVVKRAVTMTVMSDGFNHIQLVMDKDVTGHVTSKAEWIYENLPVACAPGLCPPLKLQQIKRYNASNTVASVTGNILSIVPDITNNFKHFSARVVLPGPTIKTAYFDTLEELFVQLHTLENPPQPALFQPAAADQFAARGSGSLGGGFVTLSP